jgi:hypothetical protein
VVTFTEPPADVVIGEHRFELTDPFGNRLRIGMVTSTV